MIVVLPAEGCGGESSPLKHESTSLAHQRHGLRGKDPKTHPLVTCEQTVNTHVKWRAQNDSSGSDRVTVYGNWSSVVVSCFPLVSRRQDRVVKQEHFTIKASALE